MTTIKDVSSCYFNEKSFLYRYMLDSKNFSHAYSHLIGRINLLKLRCESLQRNIKLEHYTSVTNCEDHDDITRFLHDEYNVSQYDYFIINNYRKQLNFSYLTWKVIMAISDGDIDIEDLSNQFMEEICFTILPKNQHISHLLHDSYEPLNDFFLLVNRDPDL